VDEKHVVQIKEYSMEPIITFGSESLILEMNPELTPEPIEPEPEVIHVVIELEPAPKKSWCSIS
jgi:hypothetical protein